MWSLVKNWFSSKEKKEPENQKTEKSHVFSFSKRSLTKLALVQPKLKDVAVLALKYSTVDFGITEGLRTKSRQRQLIADGKSKTMKSKHLEGRAVDVVAYINGDTITWEEKYYVKIAEAFQRASTELDIDLRWGGAWNQDFNGVLTPEEMMTRYVEGKRAVGQTPFLDLVHFELKD